MKRNFEIIPAIDIIDGKCVRLSQGDYSKKTIYSNNPLETAKMFEEFGIKRLHIVDLDGAKKGRVANLHTLEQIASGTNLIIDFGGGIQSNEVLQSVFNAGASMVSIGSVAVKNPELFNEWLNKWGGNKILLGADVKNEKLLVNGWAEKTEINLITFLREKMSQGLTQAFCTDVSKDGMLQGVALELYAKINSHFPNLKIIASGGVSCIEDVKRVREIGCSGIIIGKALYENKIKIEQLKEFYEHVN